MEVSGFEIRQGLNILQMQKEVLEGEFEDSLTSFKDEVKRKPADVASDIVKVESDIAILQEAQAYFNLHVKVEVFRSTMSLCRAVKAIGGVGRAEKRWTALAKAKKEYRGAVRRDKDEEWAAPTVTPQEALRLAKLAAEVSAGYKGAIANANSTKIEIPFLPANLI